MDDFSCQFELCACSFSDNVSVLYCDNSCIINKFMYKDLLVISEDISTVLQKHVQQNTCIAITTKPNPFLPAFVLSIHKQKCAFICLDIKLSQLNILHLINRIKLKWIINYDTTDYINSFLNHNATLVYNIPLLDDRRGAELWKINNEFEEKLYKDVSYIIQTSGTTGTNKIVQVHHKCIMSNVKSLRRIFKINDKDIVYLGTPLTFDPFVIELMLALTTGACLLIVPDHIKLINKLLLQTIIPENKELHSGVTFIQMPPSVFLCFSEDDIFSMLCKESNLRILALGGEKFPEQICKYEKCKQLQLFNLYGITEVSCWASVEEITDSPVSLGQPLDDTLLEIRNTDGNVIQDGEGKLFIGSAKRLCVINDECNSGSDTAIFRETGDIVRIDPLSKKIYYVGRTNSIIKRFGQRVCLSEIEKQVFDTTDLNSICVWDEHESKLFLFIILQNYDKIVKNKIIDRLRIKLLHTLPASANPDVIEILPSIPLTNNGKVDKKSLLRLVSINKETNININPVDVFENVWSKYFGMSQSEIELRRMCSFSVMGGNSIVAIQLISDFDSLVPNSYSTDLMALFLDHSKYYTDYCSLIESNSKVNSVVNTKRSIDVDSGPSKCMKVSDNRTIPNVQLNIVWKYELGACVDATPVHVKHQRFGDLIAVGCHAHLFVILNAFSRGVISKTTLSSAVEGSACVSICKERIIVGCYDGYMYCLNISDATTVWKYKTENSIKCTPILSSNNENIIFGSYDKALYCLKIMDGSLVWKFIVDESIKSNPILHEQKCYVATIQGTCMCVCEISGKCVWKSKTNTSVFGSPCVINRENIILWPDVKGHVHCYSCISGDKLWTYESRGFIYSSLCHVGNRVIFGCFDHNVYCLECRADGCSEILKLNVGGLISGTPCVYSADDKAYLIGVSNGGKLHVFSMEPARLLQTIDLPGEVFSSPIVVRNNVYVGCRDNRLYCIEINT